MPTISGKIRNKGIFDDDFDEFMPMAGHNMGMTYFAVSDIHGFILPLKEALANAGFSKEDPNHFLIVLGDVFDRGEDPLEVYEFLSSMPEDRLVLVKGNHEDAFMKMLRRGYPTPADFHNKTALTLCLLGAKDKEEAREWHEALADECNLCFVAPMMEKAAHQAKMESLFSSICHSGHVQEVASWLSSPVWKDYFETKGFVLAHSGIPRYSGFRHGDRRQWEEARWANPIFEYRHRYYDPVFNQGKKMVVGHFHTSAMFEELDPHRLLPNQPEPLEWCPWRMDCPIFDNGYLVGIDACTALTGKVNVFSFLEP